MSWEDDWKIRMVEAKEETTVEIDEEEKEEKAREKAEREYLAREYRLEIKHYDGEWLGDENGRNA